MLNFSRPAPRAGLLAALCLAACFLSACSGFEPYRIPIVQGNVVTREQVAALKPGMSRLQVRDILGTPLLTSVFRAERWDYVFTLKEQGREPQSRRVAVYFNGDVLDRYEADTLPSEPEFVATLGRLTQPKVPVLVATPEQLARFPEPAPKPEAAPLPPLPAAYPPLESSAP